jgi:demethylmenaquinone methyltransferase/2-methoxy-6-polyprenyl-1,4-benzoquinol methylase
MPQSDGDALIAEQIAYYRARASEYDATFRGAHAPELASALDALAPSGSVLELAAGTGAWTESVLRHPVSRLVVLDASPEMLELHGRRIDDPRVERRVVDLFEWEPDQTFDVVTFAFWLSHVPPARLADFWGKVQRALTPGGRVLFVDQDRRGMTFEVPSADPDYPTVDRTLVDGRVMRAIKVYHRPQALEKWLRARGWEASVRRAGDGFLVGVASRAG